ncbi:response regulator [Hahella sp. CR1]|uniref:response regulator n=1 Tax=Hahella sp. CR1 TaxID=2992807 RepID=UPI0024436DA7|nr:response regulator [Hahella sp. CR1]MDG9667999.1 response regulator [Hahella sp. CR1]
MTGNQSTRLILVVEDSMDDYAAMQRAFAKAGLINPIVHCQLGEEALDYLFARNRFEDRGELPALILLDLNLPGIDGFEVLKQVKSDPELRRIPVIVLTTSSDERDIARCYLSGANTYVCKPVDLSGLIRAVGELKQYWFEIAVLPRGNEA